MNDSKKEPRHDSDGVLFCFATGRQAAGAPPIYK